MYSIKPYLTGIYSREDKCGASDEYIMYIKLYVCNSKGDVSLCYVYTFILMLDTT